MNIAIVCSFPLSGRGGMENVTSILVRELENRGDQVTLILRTGNGDKTWASNFKHIEIYCRGGWINKMYFYYKLTKELTSLRPNIIIGLDPLAIYASRFYRSIHKNEVRIGSWLHFTLASYRKKVRELISYADFHLVISSGIAEEMKELIKSKKRSIDIVFIPTEPVANCIARPAITTYIYMGRLTYDGQKRVNDFIYALSKLKGAWRAIIIGDGADAEQLKKLAIELQIDGKITWTGWVSKPWSYVEHATALVLSSQYEGFPGVLVEALNRGIACLSTDCKTGPKDIIVPGINGWLYPINGINQLATLLQQIIDHPEVLPSQKVIKQSAEPFMTNVVIDKMRNIMLREFKNLKLKV